MTLQGWTLCPQKVLILGHTFNSGLQGSFTRGSIKKQADVELINEGIYVSISRAFPIKHLYPCGGPCHFVVCLFGKMWLRIVQLCIKA